MRESLAAIAPQIARVTGRPFAVRTQRAVGGGCINSAVVLEGDGQKYFVKWNDDARLPMFEAEADGLRELVQAQAVRVPAPICSGTAAGSAYLVLEYIELAGADGKSLERLGRQLAQQHRVMNPEYGWHRDNTIGSTPQINAPCNDWVEFWRQHRLGFQLALAADNGYGGELQRQGEQLVTRLGDFFSDYTPVPSLLHGDLWGGNFAVASDGAPVIFDPAVYYGDREADLAMTELFGGFGARFYQAYRAAWPLDPGYGVRKQLYNLYHVLNHLNLFGGGYGAQAERMLDALLSEIR
jgi:fructosamine-3-kinase